MRLDLFLEKYDLVTKAFIEYRNHKTNELDAWDNVITIEDTKRNKTYNFIERDLMIALEHIWYSL